MTTKRMIDQLDNLFDPDVSLELLPTKDDNIHTPTTIDGLFVVSDVEDIITDAPEENPLDYSDVALPMINNKLDKDPKTNETVSKEHKNRMDEILDMGMDMLSSLKEIAQSTEKSRDFEVFFAGLKNVAEMSKSFNEEVTPQQQQQQPQQVVTNNAVFVGSLDDLLAKGNVIDGTNN